jgi:hypothetical protein
MQKGTTIGEMSTKTNKKCIKIVAFFTEGLITSPQSWCSFSIYSILELATHAYITLRAMEERI